MATQHLTSRPQFSVLYYYQHYCSNQCLLGYDVSRKINKGSLKFKKSYIVYDDQRNKAKSQEVEAETECRLEISTLAYSDLEYRQHLFKKWISYFLTATWLLRLLSLGQGPAYLNMISIFFAVVVSSHMQSLLELLLDLNFRVFIRVGAMSAGPIDFPEISKCSRKDTKSIQRCFSRPFLSTW